MLSNSTMRVRSRSSCSSRVSRACAASSSSVDCSARCRLRCTRGDVVDRLGHHARQFLEAREAVHLQRVERLRRGLGRLHARTDLRLGLQLDVAQLAAQAVQVVGQVGQRGLQLAHLGVDARARDAHLAGLVDQAVEQRGTHAHRGAAAVPPPARSACHGARPRPRRSATSRCCRRPPRRRPRRPPAGQPAGSRLRRPTRAGGRRRGAAAPAIGTRPVAPAHGRRVRSARRAGAGGRRAQRLEGRGHGIGAAQQRLDIGRPRTGVLRRQVLDRGLQPVRHLAQAHRAGQARTALEGVQRAHAGRRRVLRLRAVQPLAQPRLQLRQQLVGLFVEDREQLGVEHVHGIDVLVVVEGVGAGAAVPRGTVVGSGIGAVAGTGAAPRRASQGAAGRRPPRAGGAAASRQALVLGQALQQTRRRPAAGSRRRTGAAGGGSRRPPR